MEDAPESLLGGRGRLHRLCRRYVDDFMVVDEDYVREDVRWMLLEEGGWRRVVEP